MATEPKSTVFDFERYGVFLRSARQHAGYNRAENFCQDVTNWTGVKINKEALYRIEKGVQPPTVEQLIAFGLVLFHGKGINNVLNKTELHHCTTPYADYLAEQSKSLYEVMTYNGYRASTFPGDPNEIDWEPIEPDDAGASSLDEYYYDELFESNNNPGTEASEPTATQEDDLPWGTGNVVNIDGENIDFT